MKITIPSEGAAQLTFLAKCLLLARGNASQAAALAKAHGATEIADVLTHPLVQSQVKAAVLSGSTTGWGSALAQYQAIVTQFAASLRAFGAFDAMLGSMRAVPLGLQRLVVVVTGATGSGVAQAAPKVISSLQLAAEDLEPLKAACTLVTTEELARLESPQGLISDESRFALAADTDSKFLPALVDSSTPSIMATDDFLADLSSASAIASLSARSRWFVAADPVTAAALAFVPGDAFQDMTPVGGVVRGVQIVVSDAIQRDSSGATLLLIDASEIAAAAGTITIDASEQATVQLDNAPADPADALTVFQSLWQRGLVGMRAERFFACRRLRANAVVAINNATYGG